MYSPTTRKFLSISNVSMLGICETKALDSMLGKRRVTLAMKAGTAGHERLEEARPKMSKEEVVKRISGGLSVEVRELSIFDEKLKIVGRIDQLNVTGTMENGKNTGIIIDDKYPSTPPGNYGITLYQKLQLSSYAVGLSDSELYGRICSVVGARITYRDRDTDAIIKELDMDRQRLETCKVNVPIAVQDAWGVYRGGQAPIHRRFDVERGEWVRCYCEAKSET